MAVLTPPSSFQRARVGERAEITRIKAAVAKVYGISVAAMDGSRGNEAVVHARHVAMWCARKFTAATWTEIGRRFGGRSPSSAAAAVKHLVYIDRDHAMIRAIERRLGLEGYDTTKYEG